MSGGQSIRCAAHPARCCLTALGDRGANHIGSRGEAANKRTERALNCDLHDPPNLSRPENDAGANPTVTTLTRYAAALGKKFLIVLADQTAH
jgi:hypothetical protein